MRLSRTILVCGGILGALGVLLGAFGAHFLPAWMEGQEFSAAAIEQRLQWHETAVRYHLLHAVALLALAPLAALREGTPSRPDRILWWAALLMIGGILLFSGSLYAMVLSGGQKTWLGMITPLGGTMWVLSWVLVAVAGMGRSSRPGND